MRFNASKLHSIAEVQTTFHWIADFSGSPFGALAEPLQLRMTSSTLPKAEHKLLDVKTHGFTFPEPGIIKRNGEITLKAFETVGGEIVKPLMEWYSNIYGTESGDVTGKQKVAHDALFGTVTLSLQNKQENKTTQTYTLAKCILKEFNPGGELQDGAEDTDYFKPEIILAYAWFNFGLGTDKSL